METKIVYVEDCYDKITVKRKPLWYHERGLMQTATGFGRKLVTEYMIKLNNSGRWYRVYCCCFSNCGTMYIIKQGKDYCVKYSETLNVTE